MSTRTRSIQPLRDLLRWAPARIPLALHASGARGQFGFPADCNEAKRSGRRAGTQRKTCAPKARAIIEIRP
ncbi:hypothetical protein FHS53_001212 [Xanthobacter tagetidis]|nr:hypothetical protein [Xanthobacter tagetidis]